MLWHEMSRPQIEATDKDLPVVLPLGSCEQHGTHLPLFVDSMQLDGIVERVEEALTDRILTLPTLWLGSSHHHLDFPGTISVRPLLYTQMIVDVVQCIVKAGFSRVMLLNGHGGNKAPATVALQQLVVDDDEADACLLAIASWWEAGRNQITQEKLQTKQRTVAHAAEFETSVMLALRPDLVDMARAKDGPSVITGDWVNTSDPLSDRVGLFSRFHRLTESGSMGWPTRGDADKGKRIVEGVANDLVEFLNEFATYPRLDKLGPSK